MSLEELRNSHHLIDPHSKILYCYIAKNACTTTKFHFLKKIMAQTGESISNVEFQRNLHLIAERYHMTEIPADGFEGYFRFCIVRHPYARLVSAYLQKFVRQAVLSGYVRRLIREHGPHGNIQEFTFSDFVTCLAHAEVNELDEHWMPQHKHLIDNIDYELIPMESLSTHVRLNEIYNGAFETYKLNSIQYDEDLTSGAHLIGASKLKEQFRKTGCFPNWKSFFTDEIESRILDEYGPDLTLYEKANYAV